MNTQEDKKHSNYQAKRHPREMQHISIPLPSGVSTSDVATKALQDEQL